MAEPAVTPGDLAALLELRMLPGVSDRRLADLLMHHGSPTAALAAPAGHLGAAAAAARGMRSIRDRRDRALETIERLDIAVLLDEAVFGRERSADSGAGASGSVASRPADSAAADAGAWVASGSTGSVASRPADSGAADAGASGASRPAGSAVSDAGASAASGPTGSAASTARASAASGTVGSAASAAGASAASGAAGSAAAEPMPYPAQLRELHDPPVLLFARGRLELLDRPAVAVIGARRHTEYGADVARTLAGELARAGIVVISGMARGIDAMAHAAALDGGTIGVLGCGIDVVYPWENMRLYERVAADGLLLSEFLPGEPPLRHHFPRRNRLIAALARGVAVVEASARSGTLITVDHALDLGREVFAVPGPVGRQTSEGTNALIRDGAGLVGGAADILDELGLAAPPAAGDGADDSFAVPAALPRGLSEAALSLWRAMDQRPLHVDGLAVTCGLSPGTAAAALLELELTGQVRQLPGKRFRRA